MAAWLGLFGICIENTAAPRAEGRISSPQRPAQGWAPLRNCIRPFPTSAPANLSARKAGISQAGAVEKVTGLVILVDFQDEKAAVSRKEIEDMVNKPGYTGRFGAESMRDYFLNASRGKFEYDAVVIDYSLKEKKKYYDTIYEVNDTDYFFGNVEMVKEALQGLEARGLDYSRFTQDAQGRLLALSILYAGAFDSTDTIAVRSLNPSFIEEGLSKVAFDGVSVTSFMQSCLSCFPDREVMTKVIALHETGHMLFLWPDLYGEGPLSARGGLGNYCIMSTGLVSTPSPPNPYLRILQGWETPTEIASKAPGALLTVPSNGGMTYRYSRTGNPKEFFLIESTLRKGFWRGFPDEGLAIYRVDENFDPTVSLIQADGESDLEKFVNNGGAGDLFHAGHIDALNDQGMPHARWEDGQVSGLNIVNISEVKDTMSFRLGSVAAVRFPAESGPLRLQSAGRMVQLQVRTAGRWEVIASGLDGRSHRLADRRFEAGSHALSLAAFPPGVYSISVQGKGRRFGKLLVFK